ncbi:MAG TPA: thioredoxin [Pseudonocardiaceae bacterium]|jgi:thioredoxin 1|nr:thioredoxin [Pseudonocardiaceae bacterium]
MSVLAELTSVTDATFANEVLGSAKPVLVEYWATWCGPCRMLAPVLAEIAGEQSERLRVVKMDTDANPTTARDQQVMGVPTMILYQGGKAVASLVGARTKNGVLAAFERYL